MDNLAQYNDQVFIQDLIENLLKENLTKEVQRQLKDQLASIPNLQMLYISSKLV